VYSKNDKVKLFLSKEIKYHLKLYIDADIRNLDGTWCFFCNKKLKKNNKNFQYWNAVYDNTEFELFKKIALDELNYKFGENEFIPRHIYSCNECLINPSSF